MFYIKISHISTKSVSGSCDGETMLNETKILKRNQLFECYEVEYIKIRFDSWDEFDSNKRILINQMGSESSTSVIAVGEEPRPNRSIPTSKGFEYVELTLMDPDCTRVILAVNCDVFIMNDQGKTIDTIFCR